MSFDSQVLGRVYFLRWKQPQVGDVAELVDEVEAASQRARAKLCYVALAPDDSPPPDKDTRDAMATALERLAKCCDSIHLVFEGSGFRQSLKRTAIAGVMIATGRGRSIQVHASMDEVAMALPNLPEIARLRDQLRGGVVARAV